MTHDAIWRQRILQFVRDDLQSEGVELLKAHLLACERCRADLETAQAAMVIVRSLNHEEIPLPDGLDERLWDRLRERLGLNLGGKKGTWLDTIRQWM